MAVCTCDLSRSLRSQLCEIHGRLTENELPFWEVSYQFSPRDGERRGMSGWDHTYNEETADRRITELRRQARNTGRTVEVSKTKVQP